MVADGINAYDLDGLAFGRGTVYFVEDIEVGQADIITNDADNVREDGIAFGRDYHGAATIAFDMILLSGNGVEAQDDFNRLKSAWRGSAVRSNPGSVSILKITRGGRTRRVYGRSRRFAAVSEKEADGWFPLVADFQCVDDLFYSDAELTTIIGMAAPSVGGLIGPLIGPIYAESVGEGLESMFVGGTEPAWTSFKIRGPIIDPSIEIVGQWSFALTGVSLASDETLTVDPSPWNRDALRSNGVSVAGNFTAASQRLSRMRIAPGPVQIILRGIDPTGTASCQVSVRETFASY